MWELIRRGRERKQALYGRLEGVFVPDMYEDLTTQRVLIMEWVEGRRLRTGTSGAPHPYPDPPFCRICTRHRDGRTS